MIDVLTENNTTMGIRELVLDRAKKEGTIEKSYELVKNLLAANKFTISEIANFASVTEAFVIDVQKSLG